MKSKQQGFTLMELVVVILWVAAIGGWIGNVIKLVDHISDPLTAMLVFRMVGIPVAPLGCVLGYL